KLLSAHVERLAAGHQEFEPRAVVKQTRDRGSRGGHLLEVVENQQCMLCTQPAAELVEQRLIARVAQTDRPRDGGENRSAVSDGGEVDEEHPVLEPDGLFSGSLDRQPCLTDATGSRECEQANGLVFETLPDLFQLRLAPDERGRLVRKQAGPAADQRREAGRQTRMNKLKHTLGTSQVLELVLAQVAQGGPVRQLVHHQGGRG